MSNNVKDINIKNRTYHFFDDINIKEFDPNNIKLDEKWYKNIVIYLLHCICDNQRLKHVKINSVNTLYLMFNTMNRYFSASSY